VTCSDWYVAKPLDVGLLAVVVGIVDILGHAEDKGVDVVHTRTVIRI